MLISFEHNVIYIFRFIFRVSKVYFVKICSPWGKFECFLCGTISSFLYLLGRVFSIQILKINLLCFKVWKVKRSQILNYASTVNAKSKFGRLHLKRTVTILKLSFPSFFLSSSFKWLNVNKCSTPSTLEEEHVTRRKRRLEKLCISNRFKFLKPSD